MREWILEIYEQNKSFGLDSMGNGYLKVFDNGEFCIEEGEYKNFILFNGKRYDSELRGLMQNIKTKVTNGIEEPYNDD